MLLSLSCGSAQAQTVTTTVTVGSFPLSVVVNPVTNKIYVANRNTNNVTVIDGATNTTTTVTAGSGPVGLAVNPVTNKIYVGNVNSNNVTVIDGATNTTTTVAAGTNPQGVALNPVTNKIYVANAGSGNVTVIDGATNTAATVAAGNRPFAVAVNPVTNKIYVANLNGSSVTVIDGATNTTTTVAAGTSPIAVVANPVTNKIYVANNGSNNVTVIDGATNATTTVAAASGAFAAALNPVTNQIYVANAGANNMTVIDGVTNTTTTVATGGNPDAIAVNPVTNKIFVANLNGNATVIDGATNNTTTVPAGTNPIAVAVNPVTDKIYVANLASNNVTVIDGATNATAVPVNAAAGGPTTAAAAVNPVTDKIYVTYSDGHAVNNVTVIDGATNAITTVTDPSLNLPGAVAVNPLTNKIYVANFNANTITVIDGATNATTVVAIGPNPPNALAVNPVTNKIYVSAGGNVIVVDGATNGTTTVTTPGGRGARLAINPVTNKIYLPVINGVIVIDGATNATTSVANPNLGDAIFAAAAVNPVTNKIYVVNQDPGVLVIDGATNATTTVTSPNGNGALNVAVSPVTNKIYVGEGGGSAFVIDGATNSTTQVAVAAGTDSLSVTVNPVTNKIYQTHFNGPYAVIDGDTNTVAIIPAGSADCSNFMGVAVNPVTNKIYLPNDGACVPGLGSNVSVITEQNVQAIPLTTTITPLSGNTTTNPTPTFTFTASSTFSPTAPPVDALYFQFDTWQGLWTPATSTGGGSFSGTAPTLPLGIHILYAYATDGQDASSTQMGGNGIGQSSPLIGNIAAYLFLVTNQVGAPAVTLDPNPLVFNGQVINTPSSPQTVTLTNTGNASLTLMTVGAPSGTNPGDFSIANTSTCVNNLAIPANGNCVLNIIFTPSGTGTRTASIQFTDNASDSPQTLNLSGTGITGVLAFESTGALPGGVVNLLYGTTLFINGGQGPFTFSITTGSLPAGLSLDTAAGHISGTPTTAGTSNFTVKVTDSLNSTVTGNFSILINPVPVSTAAQLALLKGGYAFLLRGTSDPSTSAPQISDAIGSFNFDGNGNFTGIFDQNSEGGNEATQCNVSGTYSVGADNRGLLIFTAAGPCVTGSVGSGGTLPVLAFALGDVKNGVAATGRVIKFDDNNGNKGLGAGLLRRQDPNEFTNASLAGTYAFGLTGQDSSLGRAVEAGLVTFNNSLGITGGSFDINDNGTLIPGTVTGSYTAPDANGRTVLTTTVPGLGTFTSVVYIVSANEFFLLTLDPATTNILLAGQGERQFNPNSFDLTSLKGPDVVTASGTSSGGTSAIVGVATASVVNNVGNISVTSDSDDGGNLKLGQVQNGTYTVAPNGRAVLTGFSSTGIVVYLIRPDRAFLIGLDSGNPPFGEIEPQIGGPFSASPFANNIIIGQNELVPSGTSDITGVAVLAPSNMLNATVDESHSGGDLKYGQMQPLSYTVDSTGHFKAQTADGSNLAGYLVSPFKAAFLDTTGPTSDPTPSSHPQLTIVQSIPLPPGAPSPTTTTVNFTTPVPLGSNAQSAPVAFLNAGVGPLTIQTLTNAADFSAAGTCVTSLPVVLAPGQSCQAVVTFAPGANTPTNTLLNEMITIATDSGNITITATGTAVAAGINFAPGTTINFNSVPVGSSANQTLTVTNSGAVTLTISTIVKGGANAGDFTIQPGANDCTNGTVLQQNQSCVLPLTFMPGAPGPRTATITFTDNSPVAGSMQVITLQGTGTATLPKISLNPNSINFGGVPPMTTSAAQTITVTNSGSGPLHIGNVTITPANQTEFSIVPNSTCLGSPTVPPNMSCTVNVTFTPPSANPFNAAVTITSDASNGTQMISLTGSGNTTNFTLNTGPGSGTTVTINPGDTAVFLFDLSSVNGFTGTVNLSCASQQPTITCSIVPSSVNLGPGVTATMITVKTFCSWLGPRFGPLDNTPGPWLAPFAMLMALAMVLAVSGIHRQKLRLASSLAALALFAMSFAGCASVPRGPSGATPPGTYNLVITASAPGSASQSITITLKVL